MVSLATTVAGLARPGLWVYASGRLVSGLLGLAWLWAVVRLLGAQQAGVYFGAMALFELLQLVSSAGVYGYVQRFVPAAWATPASAAPALGLGGLLAWRAVTLCLAAAGLAWAWPVLTAWLGWPAGAVQTGLLLGLLMAGGLARLLEVLLESLQQQGTAQWLNAVRNVARLAGLFILGVLWNSADVGGVNTVLALELTVTVVYAAGTSLWLARLAPTRPALVEQTVLRRPADRQRWRFTAEGYAAVVVSQCAGLDMVKLLVSAVFGPAALGAFGLAAALADIVARYLPANFVHGPMRRWLALHGDKGGQRKQALAPVRRLLRGHVVVLSLLIVAVAALGPAVQRTALPVSGFEPLVMFLLGLLAAQYLQALRLGLGLLAHAETDNRSVLLANLAATPAPLVVLALFPVLGPFSAVVGVAVFELALVAVLSWRLALPLTELSGPPHWWAGMLAATALAVAVAMQL